VKRCHEESAKHSSHEFVITIRNFLDILDCLWWIQWWDFGLTKQNSAFELNEKAGKFEVRTICLPSG
jgi:hypothetical protein